jgi:hypothetical protein
MPGKVIQLLSKNTYTYTAAQLAAAGTTQFPVLCNVDVSQFLNGQIALRVHSFTQTGGTAGTSQALIRLDGFRSSPSAEDPANVFRESPVGTPWMAAVYTWASANGSPINVAQFAITANNITSMGGMMDFFITIKQASPAADPIIVVVSADLILKS